VEPFVRAIVCREGFHAHEVEVGVAGTFPTFLVDAVVVKLFGGWPSWRRCHEAELAMHHLLLRQPQIPAPRLLAAGRLYRDGPPWPNLITERLEGTPWRKAGVSETGRTALARRLG
jgi:hypothetical protein